MDLSSSVGNESTSVFKGRAESKKSPDEVPGNKLVVKSSFDEIHDPVSAASEATEANHNFVQPDMETSPSTSQQQQQQKISNNVHLATNFTTKTDNYVGTPSSSSPSSSDIVNNGHDNSSCCSSYSPTTTTTMTAPNGGGCVQNLQQQQQQSPARNVVKGAEQPFLCAACNCKIADRYLLKAMDQLWHEDCLKCDACNCRLAEIGKSFFFKCGKIYCRRDYARLFGSKGTCSVCNTVIPAFELVMRANHNVYHLECFGCQECNQRFCVGDRFYLDTENNKILCEYDYNERLYFAQLSQFGYNSLAQLKRQISQVDDYDDVRYKPFNFEKRPYYFQ